jgi:hypothetical protein
MLISKPSSLKPASRLVVAMRLVAGLALLVIGVVLALPGIPGPGIPIMLLGLWLLSHHFAWARRALAWLRERTTGLRRRMGTRRWKWPAACRDRSTRKGRLS